jgi:chaperonin GroES
MERTILPLYDRVVVERVKEKVASGGIVIPDAARERSQVGKVIAIGPGRKAVGGWDIPLEVFVGDLVVFGRYAGAEAPEEFFEHEGQDVAILREDEILGILDPSVMPENVTV